MTEVKLITAADFDSWDRFVADTHSAGFFHQTGWLRVVEKTYGHTQLYLMALAREKIVGVLPLFYISIPFGGCYIASDLYILRWSRGGK